ncbi:hypothetical protein EZJ43_12090 [Pedobacter changchengzhani]|uniref:DoxX family protein n=1 Tax=Pedobacter changchengzhani TaxID=2529274 RepID=A0A4R5MKN4_9SPHI|nr:hypothetical protein [Pedobacter changchengzhani]TDG35755.1 hypothetical protein EZJ43_12090 [Pedobacter changchengzhani]
MKYGLDKIALQQFSSPEANILYTPFGYLEKDILFWSTVGTSKFYNIALGTIEIIASAFLFFRKTRLLGFCFAIGIVLNILIINLGFDISVKTLSAFLLVVILFNLYPFIKPLYSLFIQNKLVQLGYNTNKLPLLYHNVIKICVLVLIIGFVSYPYLMGIFKNDEYSMPIFNNAYKVEGDSKNYKRIFFHKNNYIIFQTDKDEMIDYHYELDTLKKRLILQDYQRHQFEVTYEIGTTGKIKLLMNKNLILNLMPIVWQNLPALKDGLHYTIDEIK